VSNIGSDLGPFSPITLGTVQLGLPYGLKEVTMQPGRETANGILAAAMQGGINTLDTARNYGTAEAVIADHQRGHDALCFPHIVTKFTLADVDCGFQEMRTRVRSSLETSLSALKRPGVSVLLFHKAMHQRLDHLIAPMGDIFLELMEEGLIHAGGLSAYRPEDVEALQGHPTFRYVQVPFNIFDHALLQHGRLDALHRDGVFVFVRSVFLKGLLLADPDGLPVGLADARAPLIRLRALAHHVGMSVAEAAFSYVRHRKGVGSLVVGADTPEQLHENIRLLEVPPLSDDIVAEIEYEFRQIPEHIIIPGLW
jgi:aryl-alcohol dehydrogenase-like predicted oxidoreductase